jgi:two-component system response regulator CpxR
VDDNQAVLSVRKFLLETRGYRVIEASSGDEALWQLGHGGIDLLLSDLVMPEMNGNELARRAKQMSPHTPTMIISGTVAAFDHARDADAFMPKGTKPLELLERIRVIIQRKRGPKKAAQSGENQIRQLA